MAAAMSSAFDLSALAPRPPRPASAGAAPTPAPAGPNGLAPVVQIDEANFEAEIVLRSQQVPVIVSLGTPDYPQCVALDELLETAALAAGGAWVLAKVDVGLYPQIAQAFQAQTVPTVVALLGGRVVPLVNSTVPEQQVRELLTELVSLAQQNGVTGTAEPTATEEPAPLPPLHAEAVEKLEAGDLDGAQACYEKALAENPGDHEAKLALAQVHLLQRVSAMDAAAVREAAASDPSNVQAALDVADLDLSGGHVEDAFRRLLTIVRTTAGDDKDAARARLVELFDVVGADDPRVVAARAQLMRALF